MDTFLFVAVIILLILQVPIIYCLVLAIKSLNVAFQQAMSAAGISIGRLIPAFERKSVTSGQIVSNDTLKDKPTLIGFVSHSCKRCKAMMPHWNKAYEQYNEQFNFLLIGYGDEEQFKKMLKTVNVNGELVTGQDLFKEFKSKLVAFAYFVGTDGRVIRKGLCENMEDIEDLMGLETIEFDQIQKTEKIS